MTLAAFVSSATLVGACSTREIASGGVGGAAGYEYSNKRAMDELDADYKAGRISQEEYDRRKEEIEKRSIVQ
jgi:hypothetical protein